MQQGKHAPKPLRVPPQDIEAEKALLGSIMVRASALHEIVDIVDSGSFYADKHRIIFDAMLDLFRKNEPVDLVSVSSQLQAMKRLESVGGTAYLSDLAATVPTATNAEYYATQVAKKATLRKLITAGDYIADLGFDASNDVDYAVDEAEKAVFDVSESTKHTNSFTAIKNIVPKVFETVSRLHENQGELRGVPTGFTEIDNKLAGLQKTDLIILAARPSVGKTSLALDIARNAALHYEVPVCIFSLEMSEQQLVDRMMAAEGRIDSWKMRNGKLTEADFDRMSDAMGRLSAAPIYIVDTPGNTILRMRSTARRLKSQHGLGLIVVDYLQLINTTKNYDSMVNQVTEISRSLKALAKELDVPVLALSQLSRAVEQRGGKPRLSDLRDSGSIEQDADVVMFIHRDHNEDSAGRESTAEILIEKHRNGPTGRAELFFDGDKTTFLNMEKSGGFDSFGEVTTPTEQHM